MLVHPPPCRSPVRLRQDGVAVPGGPFHTLDFLGATVTDLGGGVAAIDAGGGGGGSGTMRTDRAAVATGDPRVWRVEAPARSEPFALYHNGRRLRRGLDYRLAEATPGAGYDTLALLQMTPAPASVLSTDYVPFTP